MNSIKFIDKRGRNVELSKPYGSGGNSYHLNVNGYHYGQIVKNSGGEWIAYPNKRGEELPKSYWDALIRWIYENEQNAKG